MFISKYNQNTMFHSIWEQIFLHEFISLLWLRERGYNCFNVNSSTLSYIPKQAFNLDPAFCYCGLQKEESTHEKYGVCSNNLRTKIESSVKKGENLL